MIRGELCIDPAFDVNAFEMLIVIDGPMQKGIELVGQLRCFEELRRSRNATAAMPKKVIWLSLL